MSNYKDLVKNFSGIVHIADIQEEFDRLLTGLAQLQEKLDEIENISDLDFTKGKPSLSAKDFTLTLGGLKKILQIYNDKVIEEPIIVKLPNETDKYKAFPGLYCDEDIGIIQTNDNVLTLNNSDVTHLYKDSNRDITTTVSDNIICTVNTNRTDSELDDNIVVNEYLNNDYCSIIPDSNPTLEMNTKVFSFFDMESPPSSGSYFILPKIGDPAGTGTFIMDNIPLYYCGGDVGNNRGKRITWFYNPIWYPEGTQMQFSGNGYCRFKYLRYKIQ